MAKVVVETNDMQKTAEEVKVKIKTGIQWVKKNPWAIACAAGGIAFGILAHKNFVLGNELKEMRRKPSVNMGHITTSWIQEAPITDEQFDALIDAMDPAFKKCMEELGIKYLM